MLLRAVVTAPTLMRVVALLLFASVQATAQSGPDAGKSIEGVWIYADDPAKKIKSDPVYEGSTITIEAGGRYAFALGESAMKPLEGRWTLRGAEADVFRIHTDYGRGRTNNMTLRVKRDGKGVIVGMEVREADDDPQLARYYVPLKK
jgi:hypothetical protein